MKNQLIILLEMVLHKQNQLRPIKTDAAMFQFETYNTVLEMIRERIADSEYPTVNAPFVQHVRPELTDSISVTTNNSDEFISWFPTGSFLGLVGKVDEFSGDVYDINIATDINMATGSWK